MTLIKRKLININFTKELNNPIIVLDTKLTNINGDYKFNTELTAAWALKTPKRFKWNTANGNFHRLKRISWTFDENIPLIKEEFMKTNYPLSFINIVVNEFQKSKIYGDESFTIPSSLFGFTKGFISTEIPNCELNQIKSNCFMQ